MFPQRHHLNMIFIGSSFGTLF